MWQYGDKLEAPFSNRSSSDKGYRIYFTGHSAHCETRQQIEDCHSVIPTTLIGIRDYPDRLHWQLERTGGILLYAVYPVWMQSKRNSRKQLYHIAPLEMEYLLLGQSRSGVGVGAGVDIFIPESESLKILRLRSPALRHTQKSCAITQECCAFSVLFMPSCFPCITFCY